MFEGERIDRSVLEQWAAHQIMASKSTALAVRTTSTEQDILSDIIKESFEKYKRGNEKKNYLGGAMAGCSWMEHCLIDGASLREPEWFALLGVTARTNDGEKWSHKVSSVYPRYTTAETDGKIQHALNGAGPVTCGYVEVNLGWDGCKRCPFRGSITSPWNLSTEFIEMVQLQKRIVYAVKPHLYIDLVHDDIFDTKQFDDLYRSKIGDGAHRRMTSSKTCPKVLTLDYKPGQVDLILTEKPNALAVNSWQQAGVIAKKGDPAPILSFFDRFIPDEKSRNHLLQYLAHLIQHPDRKITHAIILTGEPGTGKSTFNTIAAGLFGQRNARKIEGKELGNRFDSDLVDIQILLIEEANHGERLETSERLKQLVTDEFYRVEQKYRAVRPGRTPRGFFLTSNHNAPLVLPRDDRRWAVFGTSLKPVTPEAITEHRAFFQSLMARLEKDDKLLAAFSHYLYRLDISDFHPNHEPPMTVAKETAADASLTPVSSVIKELVWQGVPPLHKDVVTLSEIQMAINESSWNIPGINPQKIVAALNILGMKKVNVDENGKHQELYIDGSTRIRPWAIRNVPRWTTADRQALRTEWLRDLCGTFDYSSEKLNGLISVKPILLDLRKH